MTPEHQGRQTLHIRNVHLVGHAETASPATVVIERGCISSITTHDGTDTSRPSDTHQQSASGAEGPSAQVIDGNGKTLVPGLIDAHMHFDYLDVRNGLSAALRTRRNLSHLRELLHSGVTTVRTMADPLPQIGRLRKKSGSLRHPGPRVIVAGPAITAPGGHPEVTVCRDNRWLQKHMTRGVIGAGQARETVRSLHGHNVDLIKIVVQGGNYAEFGDDLVKLDDEAIRAVIDEAHARDMKVSAHTHYQDDVAMLLRMDIDSIEHGVIEHEITDDGFLQRWAESGVPLVSTLVIDDLVRNDSGETYLATASANLLRAHSAGVRIVAGTDAMIGAMSSDSLHDELRLIVQAGLPPAAALEAATSAGAELLGLSDRGRLAEGAVGDLLLLNSNPLDDIGATRDIAAVIQGGRIVHEPEPQQQLSLPDFIPPPRPVIQYSDTSNGAFDTEVTVLVDSSDFTDSGFRTITYLDPATGGKQRYEKLRSDRTLSTQEWTCSVPEAGIDLHARKVGGRVELTGTFENAAVEHSYDLRGRPWLQGMFFDLPTFVESPGDVMTFVAIGTTGRGALKASEFELTKGAQLGSATMVMPRWRRWWSAQIESDPEDGSLISVDLGDGKSISRVDSGQLPELSRQGDDS